MTQPLVTVLMPVRNEEGFLEQSLGAVLVQDYTHLEVLVIDGESTDRTVELIQTWQQKDPRIKLLHNPGRRQSKALNIGLKAAQGEIIVRIDGHTLIEPDYVRQAVELLTANQADNVGGKQQAAGRTPMGRAIAVSYGSGFAVPSGYRHATQDAYTDTVFMGAWQREVFDHIGGWNENYLVHEDYEHNFRLRQAGGRVLLSMKLRSTYYCRDSLSALWNQYFRYGRDKFKMLRTNPASLRPRHLVAPLFVLGLVCGAILGLFIPLFGYLWGAVILLYLALNLAMAVKLAQGEWALLWRLPLVFATIHLAWGTGFWVGMVKQPQLS